MEFGPDRIEDKNRTCTDPNAPSIQAVVDAVHEELRRLVQQRAAIMKRIGTIRQTIVGLCDLFGEEEVSDDLRELLSRKAGLRCPGITQACRTVLLEARRPLNATEVCEQVQVRIMPGAPRPKNLVAAVSTVLNRLVKYGEAQTARRDDSPRTWVWVSEDGDLNPNAARRAGTLVSQP